MKPHTSPKLEYRSLRHDYTPEERNAIGTELSFAIAHARALDEEFAEVRAGFKTRITEANNLVEQRSTQLVTGWELRQVRCRVTYRPDDQKKDFYRDDAPPDAAPVLTEDMTPADWQTELWESEREFECRDAIELFAATGSSAGLIVVGRLKGRWYAALRIVVGAKRIVEEMNGEQRAVKERYDAVKLAAQRAVKWLYESFGPDSAKTFERSIAEAVSKQQDRVE